MNKTIPEIRVSTITDNISENELLSDIATDCEYLESAKVAAPLLQRIKRIDDEQLTDLEKSSDDDEGNDENNKWPNYPAESLNRAFDICMNCEEITNVKGPAKLRSTISFDRLKFHDFIQYENLTDLEDFSDSEVDFKVNEFNDDYDAKNYYVETAHVTAIKDNLMGVRSPLHTPEPGFKETSYSMQVNPIEDCCTDSEMIYTDQANTSKKRLNVPVRLNKYSSGTCSSDTDEELIQENKEKNKNINKKSGFSPKFNENRNVFLQSPKQLRQKESSATDVETIEINNARQRNTKKCQNKKPLQRANTTGSTRKSRQFKDQDSEKKWHSTHLHFKRDNKRNFNSSSPDFRGRLTDIEAFDSDEEFCFDDIKPIAFVPEASNDLVLTCENHKGGVSLVLPLNESSHRKMKANITGNECIGFTDVEDVSDLEETKPKFCRTPDLPISEQSIIKNVENYFENHNLKVNLDNQDPLTDTEEVDIEKSERKIKSTINKNRLNVNLLKEKESVTDVEDLSDDEARSAPVQQLIQDHSDTESDIISADDAEDDRCIYRSATPEINSVNSYTATKEGIGPFPTETKRKMNEIFLKVRKTKSPSPPPDPTDIEEMLAASMDEEQQNHNYSTDEDNIETHQSVVHIQHTRKFRTEGMESLHIKHCDNQPDPLTDVEEIPAIDDERPKKNQKKKSNSDECSVSFNRLHHSGYACKWKLLKGAGCSKNAGFGNNVPKDKNM
ncbi:hypothetical protein O3M35_008641 [Rhynocoris fuscipes]|uniref:Uncharacterized protein n=1 Tax=Rhynocoris fuscipes TaxID=488301 RepID=A0AAW1D6X2_9HEMI